MAYTKLDSGITESTIWQAPDATRLVWITLLARADQNGYVGASMPGLAGLARVSLEACIAAIRTLEAPDEWSRTKEHDGRRIAPADGGWVLLNHAKYREKQSADDRRERSRVAMARLRAERRAQEATKANALTTVNGGEPKLSQAEAEAEALNTKQATLARAQEHPECPHIEILRAWSECLPALPAHEPSLWSGARQAHLRARWRETAALKGWKTQEDGLRYFRKLFEYIGSSRFLTGRVNGKGDKPAFQAELEWVVKPGNWAKIIEGKYHAESI